MKRIAISFLAIIVCCMLTGVVSATGDPNIDGGGGGMGDGDLNGGSYWSDGEDGIRITVVKENTRKSMTSAASQLRFPCCLDYL